MPLVLPSESSSVPREGLFAGYELDAAYDRWWEQVLPLMENEDAVGLKVNPFKEQYWKQFGGPGPNNVPPPEK